jgi:proteic killer suppression protein
VIESFKSKDLRRYWESGQPRGINPNFASKVQLLLDALDTVEDVEQLDTSGFGLHSLTGNRQGQWSMVVSRNWRITFRFEDGNALDVDFEDYHGK